MHDEKDFEQSGQKGLPHDATHRERLNYIKKLSIFNKSMFGNLSYDDIQDFLDTIIRICNDGN